MSKMENIEQKILQLDGGSFQRLCDGYLFKLGHSNIVPLGSQSGTNKKTTLGTPDSYFVLPNEKYVFVEYTTQKQNLFKKIKEDLHKCLDIHKTKISHNEIEKIMYFHTSSNIKPH